MEKENKSSIIKEALTDYKKITEAATIIAKKKLVEEFPDKYNKILNEELNKNKKAKESYKKIDDAEESEESDDNKTNKESDMKDQVKETVKVVDTVGKGKPFETKAKKVEEDVKVTDTIGKSDPFNKKGAQKIEEERDKNFTGAVKNDTPNLEKGNNKGIAFNDNIKANEKPISNLTEEFDISELDMNSVGSALENANDEDEIITIDEIENEISKMEGLGEELDGMESIKRGNPTGQGGDAFNKLVSMRKELDEMIKSFDNPNTNMGNEPEPNQMESQEFETNSSLQEDMADNEITDADIDAVLGNGSSSGEQEVDEAMGISYSNGTIIPGTLGDHEGTHGRFRNQQAEAEKKIGGLINENKKLTKKLNDSNKYKKEASTLLESYKTALGKYRNQLKEMAIFNTNLAHVNNLLVNESLALTQDDKIKIINEFKKVGSITESQKTYKSFLSEMTVGKKSLTESLEDKVNVSIQPSSKQKLDEVVEKTAYANDVHINRMKKIMNIIERKK